MGKHFGCALLTSALAFGALSAPATTTAHAATCTTSWKHATSGDWSTAANWTSGVPTSTSDACILLSGTYTVTVHDETVEAHSLQIATGASLSIDSDCANPSELTLDADSSIAGGSALTLSSPGCDLASFFQSSGTLTNAGTITPNGHRVSGVVQNNGKIVVTGQGTEDFARWTNAGTIAIAAGATLSFEQQSELDNTGLIDAASNGALLFGDLNTFNLQGGRLRGHAPVVMTGGWFMDSSRAPGTIGVQGMTMTGDVAKQQTLSIKLDCKHPDASIMPQDFTPPQWTNHGTISITAHGQCSMETNLGDTAFVNDGTVTTQGEVTWISPIVNHGLFAADLDQVQVGSLTNASDGTLAVTLASRRSYGRFQLNVGALSLDGTLAVQTTSGFWPSTGEHFDLITDGQRTGRFATITGTSKTGETVVLQPRYNSQGMNLHAV